ncbi:MAG TPA: serine/threonine-protein kinase [Gemmatimonadaceae bacterium]
MTLPPEPLVDALRAALGPAYDLESELSGGGMSRVFVATERALNRKVVVKVLPPDLAAGVNRERFRREIQLAAQLQHPHIVPLLSAGDTEGFLYYTMPFIEGESLKHALSHGKTFSTREAVSILHDVVDALAYAHSRGVIHRDVKPANVLRSGMHAVVADFGVAKALSAAMPAVGMTTSGMAIGTPQYMAPEQLAGDPAADHRVDIYAVGLLGYELLTGAPTFAEQSPQATLAAQLTRNPQPLELKRPDVPEPLARLLMWCLAKDPGARPATAQVVRQELEELVMPSGDYPPRRYPGARRNRAVVPVAVAVVALAALAAVVSQMGDRAGETASADSVALAPPAPVARTDSAPGRAAEPQPAAVTTPPPPSPPPVRPDSSGGRAASTVAPSNPQAGRRTTAPAPLRGTADSLAQMALLLKTQAPGDPIVRPPSPNQVSQAALEERRANMGPRRKALLVSSTDSVSRAIVTRFARLLDPDRFQVTTADGTIDNASQEALDSLGAAGGYDFVAYAQAPQRRDSSYTGLLRLRDLTAHASYSNNASSRRLPVRDSLAPGIDSLAANAIRRVTQMDRGPRVNSVDPEVRAFQDRAANMGPPRRIVIWNHPPHDNLRVQEAGSVVMDALRNALRGSSRFIQVPRDSTLELLARSRNRETVMSALNADLMVSIAPSFTSQAMDSVSWLISVRDLGADRQYQERSFRSAPAPMAAPFAYVAVTLSRVMAAIEQMDTAPRRRS